jgi:crotonobetainyl-CoA:carnitine CoA-transferase CaiB-like acyl-CoA transferase
MNEMILQRTGLAPLRFRGELLARSEGRIQNGRDHNRWHDLRVYRTAGGTFVVAIGYRTQWQGESDHDQAETCPEPGDVVTVLTTYDPTGPVTGYPAGDAYAEKQARLLADVRRRFEVQVSEILAANPAFAEVID